MRGLYQLDGEWLLAIDSDNSGRAKGWEREPAAVAQPGPVPGAIEEVFPGYDGVVWYWRRFQAPPAPSDVPWSTVRFLAADYLAEVWLNGTYLGGHEGGETPFILDLGTALRTDGENLLAVRLIHVGIEPIDGLELKYIPHGIKHVPFMPGRFHNYGGIWQSVELLVLPPVRIADCFVRPDFQTGEARTEITLHNSTQQPVQAEVDLAVGLTWSGSPTAGESLTATLAPGETKLFATLRVSDVRLWTLDRPVLYTLSARLDVNGKTVDRQDTRFGFREFTFNDGYFELNGDRVILKGTHTVGHYGMGLVLPRGPEQLRQELLNLKAMGLNCCRSLGRLLFPEQLDVCDELGMFVYEETLASWLWESSPDMAERFDAHLREMILRDRNHPSVVIWGLLNETRDPGIIQHAVDMLPLIRSLDPTRVVLLNSGRWDDPAAERDAVPAPVGPIALPDQETWSQGFADFHRYVTRPLSAESITQFRTLGTPANRLFQSEFGNGSAIDPVRISRLFEQNGARDDLDDGMLYQSMADRLEADFQSLGLFEVFATPSDLVRASQVLHAENRALGIAALRSNPNLCGYSITGMVDHTMVGEGLMTLFREPKWGTIDAVRDAWQPLSWSIFTDRTSFYQGDTLHVEAVLINEDQLQPGSYPVRLRVSGPPGVVFESTNKVVIGASKGEGRPGMVYPVFTAQVPLNGPAGRYEVRVLFDRGGAALGRAHVYLSDPPAKVAGEVGVWDADSALSTWLGSHGLRVSRVTPDAFGPRTRAILVNKPDVTAGPDACSDLLNWIAGGGAAVFLSPNAFGVEVADPNSVFLRATMSRFPFGDNVRLKQGRGCWWAVDHVVKARPLTAGLPAGQLMDLQYYRAVHPHWTYVGLPSGDVACAGIGIGTCGEPDNYWGGANLAEFPLGKGRVILATLLTAENAGYDPAADQLLLNLATVTL